MMRKIINTINHLYMYIKIRKYKGCKKIIYAITPPPSLSNMGDHAQVVAIKKWFEEYFEDYKVLEFDKNETYIYSIKKIINKNDLIFLHSGGNLGDRGIWSENARRLFITNFPDNKIISLQQTIFFSNTEAGKKELEVSKKIYNDHEDLTVIARDYHSFKLAQKYFPKCKTMVYPDFVLYLDTYFNREPEVQRENILLCLRNDTESIINDEIRHEIKEYIRDFGEYCTEFDTTFDYNILKENIEKELKTTLQLFRRHELIITDRFHGVIFSVLTKTPCIALGTVDHKLTDSIKWFKNLNYVYYIDNLKNLPNAIEIAINADNFNNDDWNGLYFDHLKSDILEH